MIGMWQYVEYYYQQLELQRKHGLLFVLHYVLTAAVTFFQHIHALVCHRTYVRTWRTPLLKLYVPVEKCFWQLLSSFFLFSKFDNVPNRLRWHFITLNSVISSQLTLRYMYLDFEFSVQNKFRNGHFAVI